MRFAMNYLPIAGLSLVLSVTGLQTSLAAEDTPIPLKTPQQDDLQLPIYAPPKGSAAPRARVGGTLRGTEGNELEIVALVPDHVGMTVKLTPTLNWYLSKPTTHPLQFTLNDTQKIRPIYEGLLPTPTQAGVQSIDLKALGLTLESNVQYRWYVSALRNPGSHSQDSVAGGMIERCELSECLTTFSPNMNCDRESVRTNAMMGFWYDAMDCLCSLITTDPRDPSLRRMRAALLRQVGLNGVADWDLKSIQKDPK